MKKLLYIILFVALYSCERYPNPGTEVLEQFSFQILGGSQSALAGDFLEEEIGILMSGDVNFLDDRTLYLELEVTSGGGQLEKTRIEPDAEGKMLTRWRLGDDSNEQTVSGTVFDSNGEKYSEFTIQATSYFLEGWNEISRDHFPNIQDMIVDTLNKRSMMLARGRLYTPSSEFFKWNEISSNYIPHSISGLEINGKNEIFASTWQGQVFKSSDWGNSWSELAKPIPSNKYNIELSITADDNLWASRWEHGLYCFTPGASNWHNATAGLAENEQLNRVYQYNDTTHLSISPVRQQIIKTTDNGYTWEAVQLPEHPQAMYVTAENEIITYHQESGFAIKKTTQLGEEPKTVLTGSVAFHTSAMSRVFGKHNDTYYVLAPGGGIWSTKDFENFETVISNSGVRELFIDHTGTIYASTEYSTVLILAKVQP